MNSHGVKKLKIITCKMNICHGQNLNISFHEIKSSIVNKRLFILKCQILSLHIYITGFI